MKYSLVGKFTAATGKQNELLEVLLKAADLLEGNQGCIHYLVGATDDPDDVGY